MFFRILSLLFILTVGLNSYADDSAIRQSFDKDVQPILKRYCLRCHNPDKMTSGIRVDQLSGDVPDKQLFLWRDILKQVKGEAMPPEDEPQPTGNERQVLVDWIERAMIFAKSRDPQKNGTIRRLTVAQYRNTLRDLLGIDDILTDVLPPDAVSKDGFLNNTETMLLSPLLIEAYFDIAQKALDRSIVDVNAKPVVQNFRMDLGKSVNPEPCPDNLILGALSRLLPNQDFMVTELTPSKPFDYTPFRMRTKYRFIEGYNGNATVRGWREYDSIYHAVFACVRGLDGYPKGQAWQTVPDGLLLRPAIPSAEMWQVESTYGPRANFKISLRELPDLGKFRVTVRAAKYNDGLLLDPGSKLQSKPKQSITVQDLAKVQSVDIKIPGVYQIDAHLQPAIDETIEPDDSKLTEKLVGIWPLDGNTQSKPKKEELTGRLEGDAKFVDSPFGKSLSLDGDGDSVVIDRHDSMNVGEGEFTVAAWIHPRELRQGGIVCLGKYSWTHGWYFDMPNNRGVLRIETVNPANVSNGTVASRPGVIRANRWQHVAAVVRRGKNETRLYVNGYLVGTGTVAPTNLDNPKVKMYIGRIQDAQLFKGEIDAVHFYRRALDVSEIQALLETGRQFVEPPPREKPQNLTLRLGDRHFSGTLHQPAFLVARLAAGPLEVHAKYGGAAVPNHIVLTRLADDHELVQRHIKMEKRSPRVGVHVGLRRDCGSTFTQVGRPQTVSSTKLADYIFEGAIANYPSPDVEKDNVNYLAGVREIGVRSEYTDGREMPRMLIRSVEFEGPFYESWPPKTHSRIFIDSPNKNDPPVYAREVIRNFATRAFRRPITASEEQSLMSVWQDSFDIKPDLQQAVKDALLVVLTSPQFLFLIEDSETPDAEPITSDELASKLSYFLWNAAPDKHLLELAATNKLRGTLDSQVTRMVEDSRFDQFAAEFTSQWLQLDKFDVVEIDRKQFPNLKRDTRTQLRQEPIEFIAHLIKNNLPLRHLVESDYVVANEVTASYYDLADRTESGFRFVPIRHENKNLGGILSSAGILAGLSNGRESNPVKRGAWLARKIIAEPPDDPPPNVPPLDEETHNLTLRERLEKHRNNPGCAKCHQGIDPWGVPFEQFDAGGLFKKTAVDASSTLPDKTDVADFVGLKKYLADQRIDQVAFSFLKHLTTYAIGRSLTYHEIEQLKQQQPKLKAAGYRMQDLVRFVVKSKMFLEK